MAAEDGKTFFHVKAMKTEVEKQWIDKIWQI